MTQILQLVPRVPPAICGVGDQAWLLAAELSARHDIHSKFVFTDAHAPGPSRDAAFDATLIRAGDAGGLAELLLTSGAQTVIVHMSGYGYARNGAPQWLVKALAKVREQPRDRPSVIMMFHELYAKGPILSKAFWTWLPQQVSLRGLIRNSDCLRTTRHAYSDWISRYSTKRVVTMPVFSNFGETPNPRPLTEREDRLVLLQTPNVRSAKGRDFWQAWEHVDWALRPSTTVAAGRCGNLPTKVKRLGILDAKELAKLLRSSRYAFLDYFDGYLAKSTILAAVAAHGMACILARPNASGADGLYHEAHYLTAEDNRQLADTARLQSVAAALWGWYQSHSREATATSFAAQIRE